MKYLLLPFKLLCFAILFVLSLIFKILGLFVTYISTVLGVIIKVMGIVMDLGAIIVTVCCIIGMEEARWDMALFTWIVAFCCNCIWILGCSLGEWISGIGENIKEVAFLLFSSDKHNESYDMIDYPNQFSGETEEIYKYKQLLDEGVITQEEYKAKKKQILGV